MMNRLSSKEQDGDETERPICQPEISTTRRLEIQMIMLCKIEFYSSRNVPC
jgi:hypothetical protein